MADVNPFGDEAVDENPFGDEPVEEQQTSGELDLAKIQQGSFWAFLRSPRDPFDNSKRRFRQAQEKHCSHVLKDFSLLDQLPSNVPQAAMTSSVAPMVSFDACALDLFCQGPKGFY